MVVFFFCWLCFALLLSLLACRRCCCCGGGVAIIVVVVLFVFPFALVSVACPRGGLLSMWPRKHWSTTRRRSSRSPTRFRRATSLQFQVKQGRDSSALQYCWNCCYAYIDAVMARDGDVFTLHDAPPLYEPLLSRCPLFGVLLPTTVATGSTFFKPGHQLQI